MNKENIELVSSCLVEAITAIASYKAGRNNALYSKERVTIYTELFRKVTKLCGKEVWKPYMSDYFDELTYRSSAPFVGANLNDIHTQRFAVVCDMLLEDVLIDLNKQKAEVDKQLAEVDTIDPVEELDKMGVPEWKAYQALNTALADADENYIASVFMAAFLYADGNIHGPKSKFLVDWRRIMVKINKHIQEKGDVGFTITKMRHLADDIRKAEASATTGE